MELNNMHFKRSGTGNRRGYNFKDSSKDKLISYYISIGYSAKEIKNLLDKVENMKYTNISDLLNEMLSNKIEKDILTQFFNLFLDKGLDSDKFSNIASIFVAAINSSDFSEKEKKDMLTVFDMAVFLKKNDFLEIILQNRTATNTVTARRKKPVNTNEEWKCAADVLIPYIGGAILGNGLGEAVGLFTGLWNAYRNECMD